MNNFREYAIFGLSEITGTSEFRIYKDKYNWWNMCIPCNTGQIISVQWQGQSLIVRTDKSNVFVFSDFNSWIRM